MNKTSFSNKYFKEINCCRVCHSPKLSPILSLGNLYVSNFVDSEKEQGLKVPLELVLCSREENGCGLLQLKHTTSPQLLYKTYWYKSGINASMRNALKDVALKSEEKVCIEDNDIVLDIGCNDGTLLRSFTRKNIRRVGFDPAENLFQYSRIGTTKIIVDFFNFKAFNENFPGEKAKIITSIAMFYDLDDPNTFVKDIVKCLHEKGVWVIQMSYLPSMLQQNAFDNICHEHLEYYSLNSLEFLLEQHDLEVFDVELNDVNGGSFRTYIKHKNTELKNSNIEGLKRVKKLREFEQKIGLNKKKTYEDFALRVNKIKEKVTSFIKTETLKGKKVFVYGASTKGNTLLQFFGLTKDLIPAAAERNPAKYGKKTVGTLIPIISEEQARKEKPDYFLVLPWHFLKEFKERESNFLKQGGKFIVPLPEFKIISSKDLK
jgi:hypothetical protein